MLRIYGHYKYFITFSAGTVFISQILTYKNGPRAEGVNVRLAIRDLSQTQYFVDYIRPKIDKAINSKNKTCTAQYWGLYHTVSPVAVQKT